MYTSTEYQACYWIETEEVMTNTQRGAEGLPVAGKPGQLH